MRNVQTIIKEYKTSVKDYEKNILIAEVIMSCENTIKYFLLKYKNIPLEGEDLRAELLIEIYKAIDNYNEGLNCEFKTYLSRCIVQRCNKLYRDLTRDKRAVKNEEGELLHSISYDSLVENGTSIGEAEGTYGDYSTVEVYALLDSLDLSKDERLICEEFSKGLKPKEIADKLGLSPSMVTYKTKKIRSKMEVGLQLAY